MARAINFLYPLELPTLQEETNHQPTHDEKNVQRQRTEFNIADDAPAPEERLTVEPDDSFIDDKKRKASIIARRRQWNTGVTLFFLREAVMTTSWTC